MPPKPAQNDLEDLLRSAKPHLIFDVEVVGVVVACVALNEPLVCSP